MQLVSTGEALLDRRPRGTAPVGARGPVHRPHPARVRDGVPGALVPHDAARGDRQRRGQGDRRARARRGRQARRVPGGRRRPATCSSPSSARCRQCRPPSTSSCTASGTRRSPRSRGARGGSSRCPPPAEESAHAVSPRPPSANLSEAAAFMDGTKKILIFSTAGGTGRSYHADTACANQARRVHYLLEPGWRADVGHPGPRPHAPHPAGERAAVPPGDHRRQGRAALHRHHRAQARQSRGDHARAARLPGVDGRGLPVPRRGQPREPACAVRATAHVPVDSPRPQCRAGRSSGSPKQPASCCRTPKAA